VACGVWVCACASVLCMRVCKSGVQTLRLDFSFCHDKLTQWRGSGSFSEQVCVGVGVCVGVCVFVGVCVGCCLLLCVCTCVCLSLVNVNMAFRCCKTVIFKAYGRGYT